VPGLSAPLLQFAHGNMQTLEMELLLDTWEAHPAGARRRHRRGGRRARAREGGDVAHGRRPDDARPPVLLFTWGSLTFTCVLAAPARSS
jgi:hypothetical protein